MGFALVFDGEAGVRRFELSTGGVVRVGRLEKKNDVVLQPQNISNRHLEVRVRRAGDTHQLAICDLSSTGTGVRAPGATAITPLEKGVESVVQDRYTVFLPMRLTTGGQQTTFTIRLGKDAEEAKGRKRPRRLKRLKKLRKLKRRTRRNGVRRR